MFKTYKKYGIIYIIDLIVTIAIVLEIMFLVPGRENNGTITSLFALLYLVIYFILLIT